MYMYFDYKFRIVGRLFITEDSGFITSVSKNTLNGAIRQETSAIFKAKQQLEEYFCGCRTAFDLPLKLSGTKFQQTVWKKLAEIPYGTTISYAELAARIENRRAFRAVGNACGKNPICIIIPCHRVIGAAGKLTGYAYSTETKRKLLKLESIDV